MFLSDHCILQPEEIQLFKLTKLPVVSECDKNFFINRVSNIWNSLPDNIIAARSIASCRRIINEFDFFTFYCINNFVSSI